MQNNKYTPLKPGSPKFAENTLEQVRALQEEKKQLIQENNQLQKTLLSEQFLHSNLYKEWKALQEAADAKEDELQRYFKATHRKPSRLAFSGMLLITLLLTAITAYTLFFSQSATTKIQTKVASTLSADTLPEGENQISASAQVNVMSDNEPAGKDSFASQNLAAASPDAPIVVNTNEPKKGNTDAGIKSINDNPLYKVRSKAYLYDTPDSSTRRNAFIVHWNNSYLTLKALDDKKGFIYVVFKDHRGLISKGWLRKFDLYPVNN